jgi:SAM-dependent methyltransferase
LVDELRLESTACLLCSQSDAQLLMPTRDRLCGLPGEFRLVRCNRCGLVYLNPRPTPEAIAAYYPDDYESYISKRSERMSHVTRLSLRYGLWKRCRLVRRHKQSGHLLDVGCATGQFLAEMRRYSGWQVTGVEPNGHAAEFARQAFGLMVYQEELVSAAFPSGGFDAITLWDVFEHLHQPRAILTEIKRILKPDGILILRVPSLDSWDARVFGQYWAGLDSPRHLTVFAKDTLARMLSQAGFGVLEHRTGSGSYFALLLSLRLWLEERIFSPTWRKRLLRLVSNPIARAALTPPLFASDALGLGAEMVVVAQPIGRTEADKVGIL